MLIEDWIPSVTKYFCEFVGTFILVFTIGCNNMAIYLSNAEERSENENAINYFGAAYSIGSTMMMLVYSLGRVSGAHFNPCTTLAALLCKKISWTDAVSYILMQMIAGCVGGLAYAAVFLDSINLHPKKGMTIWNTCGVEFLYTFTLVFVVLNTMYTTKVEGNYYYGMAVGFVLTCGQLAGNWISGACYNPAVALAVDFASIYKGFGWSFVYFVPQVIGCLAAVGLFRYLHPEEVRVVDPAEEPTILKPLLAEFVGTFVIVTTLGLTAVNPDRGPAVYLAAGTAVMCMTYTLSKNSGAHFNPAVTFGVLLTGRKKISLKECVLYVLVQLTAGLAAGLFYQEVASNSFRIGPQNNFGWGAIAIVEMAFTALLVFCLLNVTTLKDDFCSDIHGVAIGFTVIAGGYTTAAISHGALNPAVAFGMNTASSIRSGQSWGVCMNYFGFELMGAAIAALMFYISRPLEFGYSQQVLSIERSASVFKRRAEA